jgi:NADPH:quinone reductase-like Zn-dependent oxidoreductase
VKRIVIHKAGGFDALKLETSPDPTAAPGEVLVETQSIGVNFADCVVRMGLYSSATRYVGWPITPGFEFAGVVKQVGEGIHDVSVGSNVIGVSRFGAYSSHVCVPRHQIFPIPNGLSVLHAGAFPTVFLTAWYALNECSRLRPGNRVLIHSAGGGVGSAAVQIAKNLGCYVVGVVGASHKVDAVRELGADAVIDKSTEQLWRGAEQHAPDGYQSVLEANGVETLRQSYAHLRPTGRVVIYGFQSMMTRGSGRPNWLKLAWDYLRMPRFNPLWMTDANRGVVAFNLSYLFEEAAMLQEAMTLLLADVAAGKLRVPRVTTFPLEKARDAHEALQAGQTVGKLALVP